MTEWDRDCCDRYGVNVKGIAVERRVTECVKQNTLRWFGNSESMESLQQGCMESENEGPGLRGRALARWMNSMKEYKRGEI